MSTGWSLGHDCDDGDSIRARHKGSPPRGGLTETAEIKVNEHDVHSRM